MTSEAGAERRRGCAAARAKRSTPRESKKSILSWKSEFAGDGEGKSVNFDWGNLGILGGVKRSILVGGFGEERVRVLGRR